MKKLLLLLVAALTIVSCAKDNHDHPEYERPNGPRSEVADTFNFPQDLEGFTDGTTSKVANEWHDGDYAVLLIGGCCAGAKQLSATKRLDLDNDIINDINTGEPTVKLYGWEQFGSDWEYTEGTPKKGIVLAFNHATDEIEYIHTGKWTGSKSSVSDLETAWAYIPNGAPEFQVDTLSYWNPQQRLIDFFGNVKRFDYGYAEANGTEAPLDYTDLRVIISVDDNDEVIPEVVIPPSAEALGYSEVNGVRYTEYLNLADKTQGDVSLIAYKDPNSTDGAIIYYNKKKDQILYVKEGRWSKGTSQERDLYVVKTYTPDNTISEGTVKHPTDHGYVTYKTWKGHVDVGLPEHEVAEFKFQNGTVVISRG